jgi:dipeptidyl aminopeptidase/acylaminoacyl peptidase
MNTVLRFALIAFLLIFATNILAQHLSIQDLKEVFTEKDTSIVWNQSVEIRSYNYLCDSLEVEAIAFKPTSEGKVPAILFIPGFAKTARDYISYVLKFAQEGFACLVITQPGFGKSQGKPDYVGSNTIRALTTGCRKFQREHYVDSKQMGVYGYSRGAMAASLLAVRLEGIRAAVFAAGIYDFKRAYEETKMDGVRRNMVSETGMTENAIQERSSILQMEKLNCPVLILHGERDKNVPVSQAYLLRSRLTDLGKDFEIKLFADRDHNLGDTFADELDFFKRRLLIKE